MAILILILVLVRPGLGCEIPFSIKDGIPYAMEYGAPYLSGFEVDAKGDFYFSGSDSVVRKISASDRKVLFTRRIPGMRDAQIGIIGNDLWATAKAGRSAFRLVRMDPVSGDMLADTLLTFDKGLGMANNAHFVDGKLIYSFAFQPPNLNYIKLSLPAKTYQAVKNADDLDFGPEGQAHRLPTFYGRRDTTLIFGAILDGPQPGQDIARIAAVDGAGRIVRIKEIPLTGTTMLLPSTGHSLERMAVGKIFLVRQKKGKMAATIFTLDLDSLPPAPASP